MATIVFGISTNPYLSFAMLFLTGALDNISVVVRQTLVQLLTPDEMRGRVSAVNAIFVASSNELGEFESGVAARLLGTVARRRARRRWGRSSWCMAVAAHLAQASPASARCMMSTAEEDSQDELVAEPGREREALALGNPWARLIVW